MMDRIGIMALSQDVAQHAASRQKVLAENVANADTPNFKARDLEEFRVNEAASFDLRRTSALHFTSTADVSGRWSSYELSASADPNGNTVSIDEQVLRSVDAGRSHSRAVTIYQNALQILQMALGK